MTIVEHGIADVEIDPDMVEGCDFEEGQVERVARGIRKDGVTVFPTVRMSTSEVVVGHIVVAACLSLGRLVCRVRLVEGGDVEVAEMRNRHAATSGIDPEQTMLETIQGYMQEYVGGKTGRSRGAQAHALGRYAEMMGIEQEAAKKQHQRAGRRLRHKRFMLADRYEKCPIETHVEVDRDFIMSLVHIGDRFRHIKSCMTQAARVLEASQEDPYTRLPNARYLSVRGSIERAQRMVHAAVPDKVCPQCGGEDEGVRKKCAVCLGMGYVTKGGA